MCLKFVTEFSSIMSDPVFEIENLESRLKRTFGLRALILKVLEEVYMNDKQALTAYEIQNGIFEATGTFWKPSPGSIYPILEELVTENFVEVSKIDNKDRYSLTKVGKETFTNILSAI